MVALAIGLTTVAVFAASARAVPPVTTTQPISATNVELDGLCSFPIDLSFTGTVTSTKFFDQDGNLTKWISHFTEQDTFSANGKTLVSDPYRTNIQRDYEAGVFVALHVDGVFVRVHLPSGGVFVVAGQNWHVGYTIEHGTNGDVAAFCAALSA